MADCLIGLGSNVGRRAARLDQAIERLCGCPQITLRGTSRYHETRPVGGPTGQGPFLNAVIRVTTELSATQLLTRTRHVEQELGRVRLQRWGPRAIDIDLLLYDLLILNTDDLVVPHPRMAVRRFVLEPACEVGADMIHAPTQWPLRQLLTRLDVLPCYVAVCCADQRRSTELVTVAAKLLDATSLCCGTAATGESPWATRRCALESLAEQSDLLDSISKGSEAGRWFLTDFWLNQMLALARTWPPGPERAQLEQKCQAAIERAPQPRFILHLTVAPMQRVNPHTVERSAQTPLVSLATQLQRQTEANGQGPVLHVSAHELDAALVELRAGIDAMR